MTSPSVGFDGREWSTLGERGNLLAGEGWRYTKLGHLRHMLETRIYNVSLCGMEREAWLGTGTQNEYEKLASLPKCTKCMRIRGETP